MNVFAASTTQDGLEVSLTTDKETYSKDEKITVTLYVKNTNESDVTDIAMETVIPDGYEITDGTKNNKQLDKIAPNESAELKVVYVAKDSGKDSQDSEVSQVSEESEISQVSQKSQNSEISTVSPNNDSPRTGDNAIIPVAIALVMFVSVLLAVLCVKSKKGRKLLSVILTVSIIGSTSALISVNTNAIEDNKSINVETSFTVEGKPLELNGTVRYNVQPIVDDEVVLSNFTSDEQYFICGQETTVTFTVDVSNPKDKVELIKNDDELVGYMHDDGLEGDVTANDGTYSYQMTETVESAKLLTITYYADSNGIKSDTQDIYYFAMLNEETAILARDNSNTVSQSLQDIENKYLNENGSVPETNKPQLIADITKALNEFVSDGIVLRYAIEDNCVYIKLTSGLTLMYEPKEQNVSLNGTDVTVDFISYQPNPDIANDAVSDLMDECADLYSRVSNNYRGTNVTLDLVKNLPSNSLIFWNGHGGYGPIVRSFLCSGEYFDWSKWWLDIIYFNDCVQDNIIRRSTDNQQDLACFTSNYIHKYCGDLSNDCIIMASCHSLQDTNLADAFLCKNAESVLGFSETVYTAYCLTIGYKCVAYMTNINPETENYYTLREALNASIREDGANDIEYAHKHPETFTTIKTQVAEPRIWEGSAADNYRLLDNRIYVSGKVTDEKNNSLNDVNVKIVSNDNKTNINQSTNNGEYSFELHKDNKTYTLTFEKEGYVTQTKTIIDVAEDRTVNVKLKKEENIPDDATVFNGHSYHIYSNFTWEEAEAYCESVGGHLVTITSQEEMNFITNELMNNTTNENCYWIGLQRDGDSWKWVTGEEFSYQNWAANEPNNYKNKGENYVHLFGKEYTEGNGTKLVGTWNDVTNEGASYAADFYALSNFGYICEWDTVNSNSNRNMYAQYFTIEPVVSKYGSSMIDEYGARLVVNDGATIRKCAMYLKETNGVWHRTLAFVGDNITSAKYVPYVAYKGEILYDGLNSSGITVDSMSPDSSGIWNMHGYYYMQTADLQDNQGNYLTLRSTSVVGNNLQIFDDLDKMKEWLLS